MTPPDDSEVLWVMAVGAYLAVAAGVGIFTHDELEKSEAAAVAVFWPLVLAYLAFSGLGKLAQRLGQEED